LQFFGRSGDEHPVANGSFTLMTAVGPVVFPAQRNEKVLKQRATW
jgi:hypothetical protein